MAGAGPAQLDAFPNIQVLDLRRTSISPFQLPALQRLAGRLRALQLTYLERVGRPHEYFAQLEVPLHSGCTDTSAASCVLIFTSCGMDLLLYNMSTPPLLRSLFLLTPADTRQCLIVGLAYTVHVISCRLEQLAHMYFQ